MKRHWTHWFFYHMHCHPGKCKKAAKLCNEFDYRLRIAEEERKRQERRREQGWW